MESQHIRFEDGDVLAIASKVLAMSQNRLVCLKCVTPSRQASEIGERYGLDASYMQVVLGESDEIYSGVWKAILTMKGRLFLPNAGVDSKNAPEGSVVLFPQEPHETAENVRRAIRHRFGKRIGVLIVDSAVIPLRRGTIGIAIGFAGIRPIRDYRSERDLYGKKIQITTQSSADGLASAAHLIMGEGAERIPVVLIRGAPVEIVDESDPELVYMPPEECLYGHILVRSNRKC